MVNSYCATVVLTLASLAVVLGSHQDSCPQHRGLPDGFQRADNRFKDRALFRIDLRRALKGYEPGRTYKFRVHTTARGHKFNDAVLVVDPVKPNNNDGCGVGSWVINDDDKLYTPSDCPDVVTTQQKEPMGKAHFEWQAPNCGCVHFRVRIHKDSQYYIEDSTTNNGPLARSLCPKPGSVVETTQAPKGEVEIMQEATREERLHQLCKINDDLEDAEYLLEDAAFLQRRTVSTLIGFEYERLGVALQNRQEEVSACCDLDDIEDMTECFGDVRRRRIDKFCRSGKPSIPFTKDRFNWMYKKHEECCIRIGESRYDCFNASESDLQRDGRAGEKQIHMDDLDPMNDLEDFLDGASDHKIRPKYPGNAATHPRHTSPMSIHQTKQNDDNEADNDEDETTNPKKETKLTHKHKESHVKSKDDDADDEENVEERDEDDKQEKTEGTTVGAEDDGLIKRTLSVEECCLNGIDAGFRQRDANLDMCFDLADKYKAAMPDWNLRCDRNFVVCCMRVQERPSKWHRFSQSTNASNKLRTKPFILRLSIVKPCKGHEHTKTKLTGWPPAIKEMSNTDIKVNEILSNETPGTMDIVRIEKQIVHPVTNNDTDPPKSFNRKSHIRRLRKKYQRLKEKMEYSKRANLILKPKHTKAG